MSPLGPGAKEQAMILITGATGKIGRELVKQLTGKGVKVRALLRHPEKAKDWKGVDVVKGDLDDAASVRAALHGVEKLFLPPMPTPSTRPWPSMRRSAPGFRWW
jgi:uncharacterized protein YbjT (DUF2867 family)